MKIMLVTGGSCGREFLKNVFQEYRPDYVIGADQGLASICGAGITPDLAIGDFDSVDSKTELFYKDKVPAIRLIPEKDFTDTHAALEKALDMNPESIVILGGTGTRLDHTMANVSLLMMACDREIPAWLVDPHNVIRVIKDAVAIRKNEQCGTYLSVMPLGDRVEGLSMRGVKYETEKITLTQGISLGVSNEIVDDTAYISIDNGYLIVMETRD